MKKGNLIALAAILIGVILFFYFKGQKKQITLEVSADFFQVKDTQQIDKVFFADIEGNSVTLERKGLFWIINDKYRVDKNTLSNMFEPLVKMRINAPVAEKDKNDLVKELSVGGKKVEIYRQGKIDRTLYIGNATADGLGTYIYSDDEGLDRPYIVNIPGWNGNLGPRFFFDLNAWRNKKVFQLSATQIESIKVQYAQERSNSFEVLNLGKGKVAAIPVFEDQDSIQNLNQNKVMQIFVGSADMYFEDFVKNSASDKIDSVLNVLPLFATVTLQPFNKQLKVLHLKKVPTQDQNKLAPGRIAQDRFYAYFDKEQPAEIGMLQAQMAAKLLQKFDRFENSK